MKAIYKTPTIKTEELRKSDILCASGEATSLNENLSDSKRKDNFNQVFKTLGDFSSFM
ncbi:MAG: hypothetical protein VZQ55_06925 [Ruminococcus sp.]|nr:hypothetical protein [Ruminococcus sp.]